MKRLILLDLQGLRATGKEQGRLHRIGARMAQTLRV
jgi:hypothetical protein